MIRKPLLSPLSYEGGTSAETSAGGSAKDRFSVASVCIRSGLPALTRPTRLQTK